MAIAEHLGELAKELDSLVRQVGEEDLIATTLRETYIRAYAAAWKESAGSVESRKQDVLDATGEQRLAAEVADCQVRDLRRRIDALRVRIDVGRTMSTTVRAEVSLSATPLSPYGS